MSILKNSFSIRYQEDLSISINKYNNRGDRGDFMDTQYVYVSFIHKFQYMINSNGYPISMTANFKLILFRFWKIFTIPVNKQFYKLINISCFFLTHLLALYQTSIKWVVHILHIKTSHLFCLTHFSTFIFLFIQY